MPGVGGIRARRVADGREVVGERLPGSGQRGTQLDGTAQQTDRRLALAGVGERESALEMDRSRLRLRAHQRLESVERGGGISEPPLRHADEQRGDRVPGNGLQDLGGLLERERWLPLDQVQRVGERGIKRSHRLRCAAPCLHATNLARPIGACPCTSWPRAAAARAGFCG